MSAPAQNGPRWRSHPINRPSPSPSPGPGPPSNHARSKSTIMTSPVPSPPPASGHQRHQSFSPMNAGLLSSRSDSMRLQGNRNSTPQTGTFAPKFIEDDNMRDPLPMVERIEGENDFSGKRYVWVKDATNAFVRGWVVEELEGARLLVQCDDGSQRQVHQEEVDKVNPAKFDKADDMAELTHLNEASVVHNLHMRYQSDLIYTYSGLFLVTINPYCPLSIYTREYINMYRGRNREDTKPHIYAMADEAFRNLVEEGQNQSILVTGESGAGKTENTKKVIQYLAAVATSDTPRAAKPGTKAISNLSEQILRANPILEAFGNAQTVRNNNSSRFGKFIRIEFTRSGQIAGAYIDWYLLEKSRVVKLNSTERNYHVFYQLLRGADPRVKESLLLSGKDIEDFEYTRQGNDTITGVSDRDEWNSLVEAFHVMGFSDKDQLAILRTIAAILHLGNITVRKESLRGDQAAMDPDSERQAAVACQLLGIQPEPFIKGLLHPRVKAGREWVEKAQTPEQVRLAIHALSKGIYERGFGDLVSRINKQLDRSGSGADDSHFIGVLDIAGFEIFDVNSFEQLCINYTNEKLQQFFNHHMFVLEQEEYAREQIEWKFIDFGKDLQPTIDLIELSNPIGLFSCLDEDSVMPKATDASFTEKMHGLWDRKTPKYKRSLLQKGFVITHYAAEVEYSTEGWLEKNKDPLPDNITCLLASSTEKQIANLFADCADTEDDSGGRNRVKRGLFRTVAQRHKEQLATLMAQLHSTHPHFVRCILPNHKKKSKQFSAPLVLDQLRCNGVLEGIRIARTGFPNRLSFAEFRSRYEVLCADMPKQYLEGQIAARLILEKLNMDTSLYRVGLTKVFFRAGVLAELEERRDRLISEIMGRFQSVARGFVQRRIAHKKLYRAEATRIIQKNFQVYLDLQANPWWRLFVRMKPLLGATRQAAEMKKRDDAILQLEEKIRSEVVHKQRLEDERRRAEGEIQKIQHTLESERALALDKEEIFRRLQDREAELADKLAGAIEDQERLEDQLDALIDAKNLVEEKAEEWRKQLEQAGQIIVRLEAEKEDLSGQVSAVDRQLEDLQAAKSQRTALEETLGQEVRMLQSQLSLKDRKLLDLESKLLKSDQDLDIKLAASTKELTANKKQVRELLDENRQIRQQMTELSSTSTSFEDLIRRKDSELALLKSDLKKYESERKAFEDEKQSLSGKHEDLQTRLRDARVEIEGLRMQKSQIEREAVDTRRMLEDRISNDQSRKLLERQIEELQGELVQVQKDLTRERQSRDDVEMLSDHKLKSLKEEFDALNEAKIIIEKEMYAQQDVLRRATEAKTAAEHERKGYQSELRNLRDKFIKLQEEKLSAEESAERAAAKIANERQNVMAKELDARQRQVENLQKENDKLADEVQGLTCMIADSDNFRLSNDQHKERLERELVTIKGRLTASENDNRSLLNKIQQKNLDIARSNSRAGDSQRTRISQLTTEKSKFEEENRTLQGRVGDLQLQVSSLEKQKEKLALSLEDLNHEINREHKLSRNAEKISSTVNLQLAEANRKLETERQLKTQAQANTRTFQQSLEEANKELEVCRGQLVLLRKVFDPDAVSGTARDAGDSWENFRGDIEVKIDLAKRLESSQLALRVANEKAEKMEAMIEEMRSRHGDEMADMDAKYSDSKRAFMEELSHSQINARTSPVQLRREIQENRKLFATPTSKPSTPVAQRHLSNATNDSAKSDRTTDTLGYNARMDLAGELEMAQNQLQMSEMRNRHLQAQIDRSPTKAQWQEESPSIRRMQKLERENFRLHDMLDDSSKKVSVLEKSIRSGQLSLKEVQTKSHEELYDLIQTQEQGRKSLIQLHNSAVTELADAKTAFDELKNVRATLEVELRDAKSDLDDLQYERDQEAANHAQLLQEFSDLQIRLDGETSKLLDVTSSLNLYKARADEYFSKLEQAEIAVLKATRAEQFAKTQVRETEDHCARIMSERGGMDLQVEDLQRNTQQLEERIEDLAADLDGALQAKKRLQNELEDYRSARACDIEDKEMGFEQARRKYQGELATLSNELEIEKENVVYQREDNGRLREEIEELRGKWDDEVLNSSTWAKEKGRLEVMLSELSSSRDEAVAAHNDAQSRIVNLLSQVRGLRTNIDDAVNERDSLAKEKKALENRLKEQSERLDELMRGESPSMRNAAAADRDLLELKASLAQQEDVVAAAVGKMRRAEALAQETQRDIQQERENNVQLHKEKLGLEREKKDLQLRIVDLETKGFSSASGDVRFLNERIRELENTLETLETSRTAEIRSTRTIDRTVRDLQSQIERRERQVASVSEDLTKARDKISNLLSTIDELQSSDSASQLAVKRAERELREEREQKLRLERELEGWKALRVERGSARGGSQNFLGVPDGAGSVRSRREGSEGVLRKTSNASRFL